MTGLCSAATLQYFHVCVCVFSRFIGNASPSTAGGLQFTFLQEGAKGSAHQVHVIDSVFTLNQASYGGAAFFLPLGELPHITS